MPPAMGYIRSVNAQHLTVTVKQMTLQIEERLLWKLFQFAGYNQIARAQEQLDENSFDSQRYVSLQRSQMMGGLFELVLTECLQFCQSPLCILLCRCPDQLLAN